jgi:hypothetical protein
VDHFVNTNMDPKIVEQLRLYDIENLARYFGTTSDASLRSDILMELLRSASYENTRVNVKEQAKIQLKKLSNLIDYEVDKLVDFYSSRALNNNVVKLTWPEVLSLYKTKPDINDRELFELKGVAPEIATILLAEKEQQIASLVDASTDTATIGSKTTGGGKKKAGSKKNVKIKEPDSVKEKKGNEKTKRQTDTAIKDQLPIAES